MSVTADQFVSHVVMVTPSIDPSCTAALLPTEGAVHRITPGQKAERVSADKFIPLTVFPVFPR